MLLPAFESLRMQFVEGVRSIFRAQAAMKSDTAAPLHSQCLLLCESLKQSIGLSLQQLSQPRNTARACARCGEFTGVMQVRGDKHVLGYLHNTSSRH